MSPRGILFIVSAPSGTGKTTAVDQLVARVPGLVISRSYTSRPPRAGETDGVDYNFVSRDAFEAMRGRGEFLEWASVFGNLYGTSVRDTDAHLARGHDLILVIDVQGARSVRAARPDSTGVFLLPPSFDVLKQRLQGRSQDDGAEIERRLQVAHTEVSTFVEYEYVVINDALDAAVDQLVAIVVAERARTARMDEAGRRVIDTFRTR